MPSASQPDEERLKTLRSYVPDTSKVDVESRRLKMVLGAWRRGNAQAFRKFGRGRSDTRPKTTRQAQSHASCTRSLLLSSARALRGV